MPSRVRSSRDLGASEEEEELERVVPGAASSRMRIGSEGTRKKHQEKSGFLYACMGAKNFSSPPLLNKTSSWCVCGVESPRLSPVLDCSHFTKALGSICITRARREGISSLCSCALNDFTYAISARNTL